MRISDVNMLYLKQDLIKSKYVMDYNFLDILKQTYNKNKNNLIFVILNGLSIPQSPYSAILYSFFTLCVNNGYTHVIVDLNENLDK